MHLVNRLFTTDMFDFTFIAKTYKEGNSGSQRMNPKQVAIRVQAKAREMDDLKPPNDRNFLRVLAPILALPQPGYPKVAKNPNYLSL